jgi:hypothetical protein
VQPHIIIMTTTTIGMAWGRMHKCALTERDHTLMQGSASRDVTRPYRSIPLGVCAVCTYEYTPGEAIQGAFSFLGTRTESIRAREFIRRCAFNWRARLNLNWGRMTFIRLNICASRAQRDALPCLFKKP